MAALVVVMSYNQELHDCEQTGSRSYEPNKHFNLTAPFVTFIA